MHIANLFYSMTYDSIVPYYRLDAHIQNIAYWQRISVLPYFRDAKDQPDMRLEYDQVPKDLCIAIWSDLTLEERL